MDKRKRAGLGAFIFCFLASGTVSKSLDVVWISPLEGAIYNTGSTIVAKWSSSEAVVSPGFKLCLVSKSKATGKSSAKTKDRRVDKGDADGKCGVAIWPQVRAVEDGFMVSIAAPEATELDTYCLEMQDNFGNIFTSPVFQLGGDSSEQASVSMSSTTTPASKKPSEPSGSPIGTVKHSLIFPGSSLVPSSPSNGVVPPPSFGTATVSTQPDVLISRRPVPTAAIAVPLSVVSAIILVAGLLGLRTRRELAKDRKRELKSLILSNTSGPEGYGSVGEVQRALSVLSHKTFSEYSNSVDCMPVLMAKPEPRVTTYDPYTPIPASISSRTMYDHSRELHPTSPGARRGKSLTAKYTAAGTIPSPEETYSHTLSFSSSNPAIPSTLLPARMPPLHLRRQAPEDDCPLPVPPSQSANFSPSGSTNMYDAIAAKLKGY